MIFEHFLVLKGRFFEKCPNIASFWQDFANAGLKN